ncbi:MAG: YicC/YloC family endoribonuclease [Blautia sp.]
MIKSMTGFGRAEAADQQRKITVELKSVNHRYLDMNIKMPKKLSFVVASLSKYYVKEKLTFYIWRIIRSSREAKGGFSVQYFRWMGELWA